MKKCIKLKTKKYRLRDSPPFSATDCPGKSMKGNDGGMYDLEKGSGRGNTILLQTGKDKYTYIGDGIRSFTTKDGDVIQKYYSPVGNSAVPYPYAVGQKYVYLMLDNEYEPVEEFDLTKDVYTQYYAHLDLDKLKNKSSKKYSVKTLFKRFY